MSFNIDDDSVLIKHNDIWKKKFKNVRHEISSLFMMKNT